MATLQQLASVLRSKNAGPFQITLDIMFADGATWQRVLAAGVLTPQTVASLYGVNAEEVSIIPFPRVHAIKVTVPRSTGVRGSGSAFDRDVYGAQQHGLLADIECAYSHDAAEAPAGVEGKGGLFFLSAPLASKLDRWSDQSKD